MSPGPEAEASVRTQRSTPQRTCIGCRSVSDRSALVRLALEQHGDVPSVVVDPRAALPGRGAWIHRDPACVSAALKRKAAHRAFRRGVDDAPLSEWLSTLTNMSVNPA
ncbi:YlxR family protein [Arthrobacter sp. UM1]|uniref:YlxR family protein n=1 Tax=Arthrobacter sp. UM1 TaxID=2766776 RepID=UPI001CF631D3|nr:YlxR family protein [Arthrobacter sp. UM1]MCB4208077.1 YlxR family protein [Arthrobacter sp. UM1]